ncbi:glycosyltransferase family 10 [Leisingera sp. F5]|uniref:glycosyltransferase family 10 domain-containing protein n=1 Tax=Leisingera sp. F5 TaxID=1813816 RepID=UPI000A64EAD5|nr:glycosyltransferase family 10 [Leisingera sp. F5]
MIRIFKTGPHARRTPLSYPALAPLFADRIELVERPEHADLYLFAHLLDVQQAPRALAEDWRRRRRPIVLLSEEPFWDTIWGRQPLAHQRLAESPWGLLPLHQLNHHTSDIFRFSRIPYYLLTNHRFANAYAAKFTRNAQITPAGWAQAFRTRATALTFMFERRPEPYHSVRWPEGGITGLCYWRTLVAEACRRGPVERLGRSWQPDALPRNRLSDWHLDKLTALDGHQKVLAAFENTHQPDYITEKIFDAFAAGALPAYYAAPRHRIHDFGLPPASWINLHGQSTQQAAAQLDGLPWQDGPWLEETCQAYHKAQQVLAALFCNPKHWQQERRRLQSALPAALRRILDS